MYIGDYKTDKRNVKGRKIYSNNDVYEGEWKDDQKHGDGSFKSETEEWEYVGKWENNLRHGKGKFTNLKTKEWYEGEWIKN